MQWKDDTPQKPSANYELYDVNQYNKNKGNIIVTVLCTRKEKNNRTKENIFPPIPDKCKKIYFLGS